MDPPPYCDKQPYRIPQPQINPVEPAPPMGYGYGANPPMPPQYQAYYITPSAGSNQDPSIQPPQAVFITTNRHMDAPDYLFYSIFTLIFCCLPLGVAALIFSIQTRQANSIGDYEGARRNSNKARTIAHVALGLGILLFFVYVTIAVVISTSVVYYPPPFYP